MEYKTMKAITIDVYHFELFSGLMGELYTYTSDPMYAVCNCMCSLYLRMYDKNSSTIISEAEFEFIRTVIREAHEQFMYQSNNKLQSLTKNAYRLVETIFESNL